MAVEKSPEDVDSRKRRSYWVTAQGGMSEVDLNPYNPPYKQVNKGLWLLGIFYPFYFLTKVAEKIAEKFPQEPKGRNRF